MWISRLLMPIRALLAASPVAELRMNVTAIGAENGVSTLECWELNSPFYTSGGSATGEMSIVHLGNVSSLSLSIASPGQHVSAHNAPFHQWVVLLEGSAYISLPNDNTTGALITGGEYGLLFAADTADVSCCGHAGTFLGSTETVFLQIPTLDGEIPEHSRLHMGPCAIEEISGRKWRL